MQQLTKLIQGKKWKNLKNAIGPNKRKCFMKNFYFITISSISSRVSKNNTRCFIVKLALRRQLSSIWSSCSTLFFFLHFQAVYQLCFWRNVEIDHTWTTFYWRSINQRNSTLVPIGKISRIFNIFFWLFVFFDRILLALNNFKKS